MIPPNVKVLLCTTPCDMRKQARGLAALVRNELGGDLRQGDIFAFFNRGRDMMRLIFWDRSGICLLSKRLDKGRFSVTLSSDGSSATVCLSSHDFAHLMSGREWRQ